MPLFPGTKLGRYEILALIGKGGMGEVYRARDSQLHRQVAIKVSQVRFNERFEREALAVAALNHPYICTLYDVGPNYLVMEYIDGQPLKGPLPVDQVLKYAEEVCLALDAAHAKQITHRDLKPGNILVTKTGVKLLDFGLARIAGAADASTLTQSGEVMGTPPYMAPEQWAGKSGDARTDIYAFGCVLYEMLTGKRAAENREPVQPPSLERVLKLCLAQDPEDRWQSARDLLHALDLVRVSLADPDHTQSDPASKHLPWLAAMALALIAIATLWATWRPLPATSPASPVAVDGLDLGEVTAARSLGPDAVLSPDGTRIIIVAETTNGSSQLFTRLLTDQSQLVALPGTEGAFAPFFSPDGKWVAFFVPGKLKKARIEGGEPVILCDAPEGRGGSWLGDTNIVAALDSQVGLSLIPAEGGKPDPLTELEPGENSHRWPEVLPGGKGVLFMSNRVFANFEEARIEVVILDGKRRTTVLEHAGMYPRFLPSGHLSYVTKGNLVAVAFDARSMRTHGAMLKVVEGVSSDATFGFARFGFSTNGILLYRKGRTEGVRTVHWMDAAGKLRPLEPNAAAYQCLRVSPDGSKLAWMKIQGSTADIWIRDLPSGKDTRLTDKGDVYTCPAWTPDGRYVVFNSTMGILGARADGGSKSQFLTRGSLQFPGSFSLDGRLIYSQSGSKTGAGGTIYTVVVSGQDSGQLRAGNPEKFLETKCALSFPALSPDGRWAAYDDAESGAYEVFVRRFPNTTNERWQISIHGGVMPVWSINGQELFYRTRDGQLMVVAYGAVDGVFTNTIARLWSERCLANTGLTPNFDLAPDGKRFAVLMPAEAPEQPQRHATVVVNFFDEVRRRVPGGN
jgi:serine/threonine-protein kinase